MPGQNDTLDKVYAAETPDQSREAYDEWAAKYDADTLKDGFCLPWIGAAFVARHVARDAGPVLDAACGTGLAGVALSALNFPEIVGLDLSPGMLAAARASGAYARLAEQELGQPIPEPDGAFAAFCCFGAFGPGHAPVESLDELARVTRRGGVGVFSVREDTYEAQGFPERIAAMEAAGVWRERERSPAFRCFVLAEPDLLCRIFVMEIL